MSEPNPDALTIRIRDQVRKNDLWCEAVRKEKSRHLTINL